MPSFGKRVDICISGTYTEFMTTNKTTANFRVLAQQHAEFVAEITPYRDTFHAFLTKHSDVLKPWIDARISSLDDTPEAEDFTLDFENQGKNGVLFSTFVHDYDGGTGLDFVVPFEYIENPQKWEAEVLSNIAKKQVLVEKAYDDTVPGIRKELGLSVIIQSVSDDDINVVVAENGAEGLTLNSPNKELLQMNFFTVSMQTGEVTSRRLF